MFTVELDASFTPTGAGAIQVYIDYKPCTSIIYTFGAPATIECTTGARTGIYSSQPYLRIYIDNNMVANGGDVFYYVSRWSEMSTWRYSFKPDTNESVQVNAGLNLLVDENTPVLNLVILDGGSMIFPCNPDDPNALATFDANYIFINDGGYMEVGKEEDPYCSKIEITMHGSKYDPQMPIYGNKGIAVRRGTLEMHGTKIEVTWTSLIETALAGTATIKLDTSAVSGWVEGD